MKKTKLLRPLVEKMENKAMKKRDQIVKYEFWGALCFICWHSASGNRCMDRRTGGIADRYGYQESFQGDFAWNLSCSRDHDTDFLWCTWTYHQIMKNDERSRVFCLPDNDRHNNIA